MPIRYNQHMPRIYRILIIDGKTVFGFPYQVPINLAEWTHFPFHTIMLFFRILISLFSRDIIALFVTRGSPKIPAVNSAQRKISESVPVTKLLSEGNGPLPRIAMLLRNKHLAVALNDFCKVLDGELGHRSLISQIRGFLFFFLAHLEEALRPKGSKEAKKKQMKDQFKLAWALYLNAYFSSS